MSLNMNESHPYYKSLSLVHPKLINWNTTKPHNIPNFESDQDIYVYLNVVEPYCLKGKMETYMDRSDINHLIHMRKG